MQWYYVIILIVGILTLLAFLPLFVTAKVYLNIKENLGAVLITLWGVKINCFQIRLEKFYLKIIKHKGKDKDLKLIDIKTIFAQYFAKYFYHYLLLKQINIYFSCGKMNDIAMASVVNGFIMQLANACFLLISNQKGNFNSYLGLDASSDLDKLKISSTVSVVITPLALIIALIKANNKTKRTVLYEKFGKR